MNEISKKIAGVFAHAQGFVLIADVIELGEYKGLGSVLFIPRDVHDPLRALESNFLFGMGLMHYPLYTYQPSTPNE